MNGTEPKALKIVVIGAGLGGLAAAISLKREGHDVTILERAPELTEATPNMTRILLAWGLEAELAKSWVEPERYAIHSHKDGELLFASDHWNTKMRDRYGAPFISMHRADLQMTLYRHALDLGVQVLLGQHVKSISSTPSQIAVEGGQTYEADLVVGADGLWSVCREILVGQKDPPVPTGDLAYRLVLNLDDVTDPEIRDLIRKPSCRLWIGPQCHVVGYSIKSATRYNMVLLVPDDLPAHVSTQPGDVGEMRAMFEGWDPLLTKLLSQVDSVLKWKLMHHPEMATWINKDNNLVLMGDACHPMLPYLGQGAASAIEDGAALGIILGAVKRPEEIPPALHLWQELRKTRGEALARTSMAQRNAFHMAEGPEQQQRDVTMREYSDKEIDIENFPSRWADPEVQRWLFGYDARTDAKNAVMRSEKIKR